MAAFTSKATGNWSASGQTTWNEVGVPGNGDTVTITHTVTVDANTIVGPSGASGTVAITISSPGVLVIAAGITLTCRGDIRAGTGGTAREVITCEAGSTLEMDASQAASPTSQVYEIRLGAANGDRARFGTNGTSGSRVSVISNSGGGNAYFTRGGFTNTGHFLCEYTDFTRIGDGTRNFNRSDLATSAASSRMDFTGCIFDACGTWTTNDGGTPGAASNINTVNCTWKNTAGAGCTYGGGSSPTGTRVVKGCVYDKTVTFTALNGYSIGGPSAGDEVLFRDGFTTSGSAAWTLFQYVLSRRSSNTQETLHGDADDCFFLQDHTTTNPHFVGMNTSLSGTLTGCLFRYTGTNFAGDCILLGSPGAARTVAARQCIVLPNGGGDASGSLISALGNANISFSAEHCTMMGNGNSSAGVTVGETYAGYGGMCTSFKSNIVWKPSGTSGLKWGQTGTTSDIASAANLNYNCGWNLAAGSQGKGYTCTLSAGSPGANDVDEDPGFVDSSRTEATWDTALGGAGTTANALAELAKKNDPSGYDSNYTIQALIAYLRAGFAPTNTNLQGTAHDAGDIGAVAVVSGAFTLVAGAGTFTETGGAAGLTAARQLPAAAGALSLTGQAGNLNAGRLLAAAAGSIALTGQATGLRAARQLQASAGSFVLSGAGAGLTLGRSLAAATGAFTLSGIAAALRAARQLAAAVGSFAHTGQAAQLLAGRRLTVAPGSFALTGVDATLTYSAGGAAYALTAAVGAFSLTGQAVSLRTARQIAAGAGEFTLSGVAAALRAQRQLVGGTGALTLTGPAAGLRADRRLGAVTGAFTLTGSSAAFLRGYHLGASAAAFLLTGQAAALTAARRLTAGLGTFVLTGFAVTLDGGVKYDGVHFDAVAIAVAGFTGAAFATPGLSGLAFQQARITDLAVIPEG